jgi:hypothetical protein
MYVLISLKFILKKIFKIVLQYRIEGEYVKQFKREFKEEEEVNSCYLLTCILFYLQTLFFRE